MINDISSFLLSSAWILSVVGLIAACFQGRNSRLFQSYSLPRSQLVICLCVLTSLIGLAWQFCGNEYTNQYVWQHSDTSMSWIYKITAIWGGMDGSMLLWGSMLSVSSALVVLFNKEYPLKLRPWIYFSLHACLVFFLTLLVFYTNPFRYLKADFIPPEGNGLNPLLQNPYMAIHPPMLYLGFTTFTVPFAFCLAGLLAGAKSNEWIRLTKNWTLVAWCFLTAGIVLGGHWAYIELGWGGFWAWDPVENASFLPWLTGTAYLHSVMVQERKNMLKVWNVWLITITFALTIFGTFLTRSGIVQSVHAFASTDIGPVFIYFLVIIFAAVLVLTLIRRKELAAERVMESMLSREAAFLFNNLLLLSICFATLWGVMFPVFSEALTGHKQSVGIPFFNAINVPLFLLLIFLMGIGPMLAWRRANFKQLRKSFMMPFISASVLMIFLIWAGVQRFFPLISYAICFFVTMAIMSELYRGVKSQKLASSTTGNSNAKLTKSTLGNWWQRFVILIVRHRDRYAGYLVHFGVVVMVIGITASMAHKIEQEFSLGIGETIRLGRFDLTLESFNEVQKPAYVGLQGKVLVKGQSESFELYPEVRQYLRKRETTTEVALRMGLREDLYLVLAGTDNTGTRASFKAFINPLQVWLWIGTLIALFGAVIILIPRFGKRLIGNSNSEVIKSGIKC